MGEILIKNVEMPKHCAMCGFHGVMGDPIVSQHFCKVNGENILTPYKSRLLNCPLMPIPPHGDLIDRDALVRDNGIKEIPEYYEVVRNAPIIISADGSDMESLIHIFEEDEENNEMDSFIRILKD